MFDSQVIDVDQEQNFIHFEENNKEDEDVYDPRIYMFDKNGESILLMIGDIQQINNYCNSFNNLNTLIIKTLMLYFGG